MLAGSAVLDAGVVYLDDCQFHEVSRREALGGEEEQGRNQDIETKGM
jgi:hypothetical protein